MAFGVFLAEAGTQAMVEVLVDMTVPPLHAANLAITLGLHAERLLAPGR